ncbi:MAG: type IV pilin-like G/H family protein [Microcoleaceae cyanobacterium]
MKTEFKAKFLQHVAKRKREEGFTLIELLVVIIIIGILSAIALPSFLNQANKAKQSEAKQYLSSINKGQQASYTEFSGFKQSIDALGVGIKTQTTNYEYTCILDDPKAKQVNCQAKDLTNSLQSFLGAVYLIQVEDEEGNPGESTSRSTLCETPSTGKDGVNELGTIAAPGAGDTTDPKCENAGMKDV